MGDRPGGGHGGRSLRTFRYSKQHPQGVIFDTDPGMPDPHLPAHWRSLGWVEHASEVNITQEQMIEAVVKAELAKQSSDRPALEKELEKKTGEKASSLISDEAATRAYNAPSPRRKSWQRDKT